MGTAYDDVTGASASQTVWQPFPRQNFPFQRSRVFPTATAVFALGIGH
jgi:hypothetical protein